MMGMGIIAILLTLKRSLEGPCNRLSVCLSVCLSVTLTPLLRRVQMQNHMSKENRGNHPDRKLDAEAKQAPRISVYK
jgi:hypothetical protein